MAEYVLMYSGGKMPQSEAEQAQVVEAWDAWFEELGTALKDSGKPFTQRAKAVHPDGSVCSMPAEMMMSGYSIVEAPSIYAATAMAQKCPVLLGGARIAVFETTKST